MDGVLQFKASEPIAEPSATSYRAAPAANDPAPAHDPVTPASVLMIAAPRRRAWRLLALLAMALVALTLYELEASTLQARELNRYARALGFALDKGPSDAIVFPEHGPFDERLGYARLPGFIARLKQRAF